MFPVIGIEIRKGYKFIVVRDGWGLVPEATNGKLLNFIPIFVSFLIFIGPDSKYGQCRLFQIP